MDDFEIFPKAFPKIGELFGTPFPEGGVILKMQVLFPGQPLGVAGEIAVAQKTGGRLPKQFRRS